MRSLIVLLLLYATQGVMAQHLPISHNLAPWYMHEIRKSNQLVPTSVKPLLQQHISGNSWKAELYSWNRPDTLPGNFFLEKLRQQPVVLVNQPKAKWQLYPLLNIHTSTDLQTDSSFFTNTRGIAIKGTLGGNIAFYTSFRENQAYFPAYINNYIHRHVVVPGQGVRKTFGENNQGHDFSQAAGYIIWQPGSSVTLRMGHHKHFIGEGYRSLLLSDNTSNYPFIDALYTSTKWSYHAIWAELQDFTGRYYDYHYRKLAGFQYLIYHPVQWFEAGIFQGVKYNTSNASTSRKVPPMFYSPVLLSQMLAYGLNGKHNVLAGLQVRTSITPHADLYAQLMVDEWKTLPWKNFRHFGNQAGLQAGLKHYNLLPGAGRWHRLFARLEYNRVRPYTYAHQEQFMEYTHLNQPLAHPMGAGFNEYIAAVHYRFRDIGVSARYLHAITSKDTAGLHTGSNIFLPDKQALFTGKTQTPNKPRTTISHLNVNLTYLLNPAYNLYIFAGLHLRNAHTARATSRLTLLKAGIRTDLQNFYFDF